MKGFIADRTDKKEQIEFARRQHLRKIAIQTAGEVTKWQIRADKERERLDAFAQRQTQMSRRMS